MCCMIINPDDLDDNQCLLFSKKLQISIPIDTIAPMHPNMEMRLTINLDEDLYRMAKSFAITQDCSISAAVNQLLRRLNEDPEHPPTGTKNHHSLNSVTGLPVVESKTVIHDADVNRMEESESLQIGYHD